MKIRHTLPLGLALISSVSAESLTLENQYLRRVISTDQATLSTQTIENKRAKQTLTPEACAEFSLRLSQGTDKVDTDFILTAKDFKVTKTNTVGKNEVVVDLANAEHGLQVTVSYRLEEGAFYMRKRLELSSQKSICLERVDVDSLSLADAYQPYQEKKITAMAPHQWKPGLGQPLFTTKTGTFWGTEFPASFNYVDGHKLRCGYLYGRMLKPGETYTTYDAVMGVSDDPAFTSDAFYDYINEVRVRPLRLQTQYNSWFDYHGGVTRKSFAKSVNKVNDELCVKRGVSPLKAYVIDDGWQDSNAKSDWSDQVWKVNGKFDPHFESSQKTVADAKSTLGLWLSPGCNFGAKRVVPSLREKGWGGLTNYMSLANTKYMDMLEERMVQLTREKTTYFKLDGCFGHLNIRDFDIDGAANGVPTMPQLGTKGWASNDKRLNDSKYDELKSYYLAVGTERMMRIFQNMAEVNPEVYIVISNGAYLSPWWLMHVDAVWMINAGDAARGSDRTSELVYRDGVYHNIWAKEKTHYPMNSLFNHEPKKVSSKESKDSFRKYLYMNMSRGTGFVELYLKTFKLEDYDWDVLAESMLWVEDVFPTFLRSRMHGGDPKQQEVYGFTAWDKTRGYISIHNPGDQTQTYSITLDRKFGLIPGRAKYQLSSPLADSLVGLKSGYAYGDTLKLSLQPGEIRILNFDPEARDWSRLQALQNRTKRDYDPATAPTKASTPQVKGVSLKGHPALGQWSYLAGKSKHSREFTSDGKCILRKGEKTIWVKACTAKTASTVTVDGNYRHTVKNGQLDIEGRYQAKKEK